MLPPLVKLALAFEQLARCQLHQAVHLKRRLVQDQTAAALRIRLDATAGLCWRFS
jgi:hypothetical protein